MSAKTKRDPPFYPAFLNLRGIPVLVAGGGSVALRKTRELLAAGARVTVVSPAFRPEFGRLSKTNGALELKAAPFRRADLRGKRLIFAATDQPELNAEICLQARKSGVWSNCAAPPGAGDFVLPSTVRRGPFCIAVSTGGASAALAAHWRRKLEKLAGPEWGQLAELLGRKRKEVLEKAADPERRRALLLRLGAPHWALRIKRDGLRNVARAMDRIITEMLTS